MANARDIMNILARKGGPLHELTDNERNKLQETLLGILSDIHNACRRNGVKYMMVGGTALGAVRHEGFIPWDDDIDIAMLRSDWEKFKINFEKSLGDKYILEAPGYMNKDTKMPFGKVYLKNSELVELQHINAPFCNGIYVDIFIYDNVSRFKVVQIVDSVISDFMIGIANSQIYYLYPNAVLKQFYSQTFLTKFYYRMRRLLGFLFSWISHKKLCELIDIYESRHVFSGFVTSPSGRKGYLNEILEVNSLLPFKETIFQNKKFDIMNNVEIYLQKMYGPNYMKLPPEEKRERHCVYKLSFPNK